MGSASTSPVLCPASSAPGPWVSGGGGGGRVAGGGGGWRGRDRAAGSDARGVRPRGSCDVPSTGVQPLADTSLKQPPPLGRTVRSHQPPDPRGGQQPLAVRGRPGHGQAERHGALRAPAGREPGGGGAEAPQVISVVSRVKSSCGAPPWSSRPSVHQSLPA